MNFILGFDDNYCPYAAVTITSVCKNNSGRHTFFVITHKLTDHNKKLIAEQVKSLGSEIRFLYIADADLQFIPPMKKGISVYVSIASYFRLFLTNLLPDDVDRVIYLDCDMIVVGSLEKVWKHVFSECSCILAVDDQKSMIEKSVKRLGYDPKYSYFNAGFFMLDLKKARLFLTKEKIKDYIIDNLSKIKLHDQDILNGLLFDKRDKLSIEYNVLDVYYKKKENQYYLENTVVIHFSGAVKPWHRECDHPMKHKFFEYLSNTAYSDISIRNKYSFGEWFVVTVKKTIVSFLNFISVRH